MDFFCHYQSKSSIFNAYSLLNGNTNFPLLIHCHLSSIEILDLGKYI